MQNMVKFTIHTYYGQAMDYVHDYTGIETENNASTRNCVYISESILVHTRMDIVLFVDHHYRFIGTIQVSVVL